ncbi:UDP-glucose 4-epimerase [hydrothermal vent metagenome]|uniref:UDP-glucose 4-epimerase n=1 Tax=hydrothermal vent metagenome TaxID=652676 RepID=A0A3B1BWG7_9ZZZZ
MKRALVTGGAGYVGSHTALTLKNLGWKVVIFDDLFRGHSQASVGDELIEGSLNDKELINKVMANNSFDAVLHFAALSYVGESTEKPAWYYRNNISGGLNLLEAMVNNGVSALVFSSTAATYGEPEEIPITEDHPKNPINPYGYSKLTFERMAIDIAQKENLRPVFLRYFNAAGADPGGGLGEDHTPETHLIPLVIDAALGRTDHITIFGADYPTDDGTCIRDYIHVTDLAEAHVKALDYIDKGGEPTAFNLGSEKGYSVRQVIEMVDKVSGLKTPVKEGERRIGDPSILVASAQKAKDLLGWNPQYSDLETIVRTAFDWRKKNPGGYA